MGKNFTSDTVLQKAKTKSLYVGNAWYVLLFLCYLECDSRCLTLQQPSYDLTVSVVIMFYTPLRTYLAKNT